MSAAAHAHEPEKVVSIDAEYLSGKRFPYQEDISAVEDIDLGAATPGKDLNWLEDVALLEEEGGVSNIRQFLRGEPNNLHQLQLLDR